MSFDQIRLDRHEGIALLTLNRPDRMNAFTGEMMQEIITALDECDADDGVRAVIFTGHGEKAYCAGADLGAGAATFDYDKRADKQALLPDGTPASPIGEDGTINWSHPLIRDGGGVVNISTGLARFALPGYAAYAAMKGAVEVLTRYLAKELGARGIAVNVVAPGAIETDFGGGTVRDNAQVNAFIAAQTALGRAGQPDDIGGVIAALLAPGTGWINAQRIEASGGMFL